MNFKKILVVPKHPDLERFLKKGEKPGEELRKKLLDMHSDADGMFADYDNHNKTLEEVLYIIERQSEHGLKHNVRYPEDLKNVDFDDYDLIMPVGGDGTLLHPAHYCLNQFFFGTNSNPARSVGHWLSTKFENFERDFQKILNDDYILKKIPRLQVTIFNDEVNQGIALNEVFFGKFGLKSSKYIIIVEDKEEFQQSSGIVTALKEGATGWLNNIPKSKSYKNHDYDIQWIAREPRVAEGFYEMNQGFSKKIRIISEDQNNIVSLDSDEENFCYKIGRGQYVDIQISNHPLNILYASG